MYDPESMAPGTIMPAYPWLIDDDLNTKYTSAKIKTLKTLGTPYPDDYAENANQELDKQAQLIAENLRKDGIDQENLEKKEIIALIAYLQRLGTDIKPTN